MLALLASPHGQSGKQICTVFPCFLPTMRSTLTLPVTLACFISLPAVTAQGNNTCKTTSLSWYTSAVGETPCRTYEQLRQICGTNYRVGSLSPATPPDTCDDQYANCCCNSISFALSMLCLNCQQGVGTGLNGDNGIDARAGTYQDYLGNCSPKRNQSLPDEIQRAVCNTKIKIEDNLYGLFWGDGSWYYLYTRSRMQAYQQASANNTFTHCASTTINSTSSSKIVTPTSLPNPTGSSRSSSRSSSLSAGAIAGVTIGSLVLLFAAILFLFLWRRRRHGNNAQIKPFFTPAGDSSSPSHNNLGTSVGISQSGYNNPPQAQLPSNSSLPPSSRSGKHALLQTSNNNPPTGHSPLSSVPSSSNVTALPLSSQLSSGEMSERHVDAGPLLQRSASGRLPPAYGEFGDGV